MRDSFLDAVRLAKFLLSQDVDFDVALANPQIPDDVRQRVREFILQERTIFIQDPRVLADPSRGHEPWLDSVDRSNWYYWQELRTYLLTRKAWPEASVRSIDDATDRILRLLEAPNRPHFSTRGLVLGHIQSGKTANYTGLIAKAADTGYRLFIVLAGIHNSLRQQTQRRLEAELVGSDGANGNSVPLPPAGKQWHTFTSTELTGDFDPGQGNQAALQGAQPVLLVVKKNATVLRRLLDWLSTAPQAQLGSLPALIIDDEADQASINTGGNITPDDVDEEGLWPEIDPSTINSLIRQIVSRFSKAAYVAYTATPFANVLIDHRAVDTVAGNDLYPRDFIVDLPKPWGYLGPEEVFGMYDSATGERNDGLGVVRHVPQSELDCLRPPAGMAAEDFAPCPATSLLTALEDFILAGAARRARGDGEQPATMLIHTSQRVAVQGKLVALVDSSFRDLKDEWRYQRTVSIRDRLKARWDEEFRPNTRALHISRDFEFEKIEEHIGPFLEAVQIKKLNSEAEDILDYEREPSLKTIVVGGNRLSRGLTLEGLLVSLYIRESAAYDTLMQMGRWFGFRDRYEDLMRVYTTPLLEAWFRDLALVEFELRADIRRYEDEGITPLDLGVRIRKHPSMLVTSPLKMKSAQTLTVQQSFSGSLLQTIYFDFEDSAIQTGNMVAARGLLASLGKSYARDSGRIYWQQIDCSQIVDFLRRYRVDPLNLKFPVNHLIDYVERQVEREELTEWTVVVAGRQEASEALGQMDLGIPGMLVNAIERTRITDLRSLGVITDPGDEETGLTAEQLQSVSDLMTVRGLKRPQAVRSVRPRTTGVLMLYPISRHSGRNSKIKGRGALYPEGHEGPDIIGLAVSLPYSDDAETVEFVIGSVNADS